VANPQVGDVLGGKFRVERVLGTGGMGVVLAAFHMQLEQRVALKLLQADAAKQPEVVTRFAREARAAARIQSEHVARVLDVGALESGEPYMVMEYLEGDDLEALLRSKGPLPVVDVVGWVLQACEAIAEAHAMGIVHRDLKPANLYLAERTDGSRTVKVLDFGISKVLEGTVADASLTRTSAVMGSPMYMSPEQLRSARDVDARADIWALGITLYELFCGKGPFSTGTVPEVCAAILKDTPQPPRELRAEVPEGLQAVVLRCLEKDVARRYANTAELALALLSYGPPGSEVSIERISRVLQKGSRSLRGPALPMPDSAPQAEPRSHAVVELTATKPSRSGTSLEEALAQTKLERRPELPEPPQPDPRATASATSISSWDGRQALAQRPRSRAAFVIAGVVGLALVSGVVIALSSGGGDEGQAGEAAPPSEVTPPPVPMPPTPADVPAAEAPPVATIASAPEPSASGRPAVSVEIVRGPLPKPRATASAAAGSPTAEPTSAATASPSSTATAAATAAPTAGPTAASTTSAKAAPKPAPSSSTPTSKP
jgi:serine/threonine-protein kinase